VANTGAGTVYVDASAGSAQSADPHADEIRRPRPFRSQGAGRDYARACFAARSGHANAHPRAISYRSAHGRRLIRGITLIIDFHTHIFSPQICRNREPYLNRDAWFGLLYSNPRSRLASAEDLLAAMDVAGIDKSVTFGFAYADAGLCRETNDYVIDAVHRYPHRLIGFAAVNPRELAEAAREVERCAAAGLRGIGELTPAGQGFAIDDMKVMGPLAEAARQHGLPILLHTNEPVGHVYAGKGSSLPWEVVRLAQQFPDVVLVCAHWGGGLFFYELMPELLATLKNVYYDTAASPKLYRDRIFRVGMEIASDKLLFATDYPLLSPHQFLGRLRVSGLSGADERRIMGDNARRILHIAD